MLDVEERLGEDLGDYLRREYREGMESIVQIGKGLELIILPFLAG
jgi:hypothetical protein